MDNRETNNTNSGMSRSNRNSKLYRQAYSKYQDLDNLPLEDNTDEIDVESLKQLLSSNNNKTRNHREDLELELLNSRKRNTSNEKVHDINKLLEKAKYENKRVKESNNQNDIINNSKSILETLSPGDYDENYTEKDNIEVENESFEPKQNLEMTRELKNLKRNIAISSLTEQVDTNSDLSLDLLSDLKPTNNTIVTEPINKKDTNEEENKEQPTFKKVTLESDGKDIKPKVKQSANNDEPFFPMNTSDTTDIDIIKEPVEITQVTKKIDNDFFTSSYEFSRKDFVDSDDDEDDDSSLLTNVLKIILLILSICAFTGVIIYFILNYGINK